MKLGEVANKRASGIVLVLVWFGSRRAQGTNTGCGRDECNRDEKGVGHVVRRHIA